MVKPVKREHKKPYSSPTYNHVRNGAGIDPEVKATGDERRRNLPGF